MNFLANPIFCISFSPYSNLMRYYNSHLIKEETRMERLINEPTVSELLIAKPGFIPRRVCLQKCFLFPYSSVHPPSVKRYASYFRGRFIGRPNLLKMIIGN